MSTIVVSEGVESKPVTTKISLEVEFVTCYCCGLMEECTLNYIERIRERYQGKWICGLCGEAVNDETLRCKSIEEALDRHINFFNKFRSLINNPPADPIIHLISAMRQILRRTTFDSLPSTAMKNTTSLVGNLTE